jgi:glucans biosynthesis protein C
MILVVATHAALSFMVTPIGWAVQDSSQHLGVDLFVWVVRAFAMPTFFWLSGYFSRVVLDGSGMTGFVRHRIKRILIPLAIALVPCSLVLDVLWDWGREVSARATVADNIPKLQSSELPIFLGHLWYLYYLLWFSLVAAIVSRLLRSLRLSDAFVIAIPAMITIGVLAALRAVHTDTPLGFVPNVPIALYMGAFFLWGWLVQARPDELARYGGFAWYALAIAPLLLGVVIVTLYGGLDTVEEAPLYASAASGLFTIAMVVAFVGLCVRYRPHHAWLRLASESSYWFYIAHLPIVVALQIAVARVAVPWPIKLVAIIATTTLVCVGTYALWDRVKRRRISAPHR